MIRVSRKLAVYVGYAVALTSGKVAGSIPDGLSEIFHCLNSSGRPMALASSQLLTEMSTCGAKAAGA